MSPAMRETLSDLAKLVVGAVLTPAVVVAFMGAEEIAAVIKAAF